MTQGPQHTRTPCAPVPALPMRGLVRAFVIGLTTNLVLVGILLLSAGRLTVWQAWVYATLGLGLNVGQRLILSADAELARERARPGRETPAWDRALLGVGLLLTVAMLVTAGLQLRHARGPSLSIAWFVVGLALDVVGGLLFLWALRENRFFTAVVRIQAERGHAVCTTGPYRFVRHPGNLGMILGTVGTPLLFQSTWCFVPAVLATLTLVVRTRLEDALLTNQLNGYRDYRAQTKFRLVPGLW